VSSDGSGRLAGKVALITGAGSGMGASAAALFASEGASVALIDISASCEEVAQRIRTDGGDAFFVHADVTNAEDVANAVRTAVDRCGRLDVLYNNAGIGPPEDAAIHELPVDVWEQVMAVNVTGMYLCCRYGIEAMLANEQPRRASIVNTASIAGLVGNSTLPSTAYTVSKGAVMALTKQVAVSYAGEGIRCNAVCPGPIETPILAPFFAQPGVRERFEQRIPIGRLGQPEDVARLALFLASEDSAFITGALIVIDGGITAT
jgi:NAD(P)-dependent dehydrogenase (short-subunit alcohol dehydrogenase family)